MSKYFSPKVYNRIRKKCSDNDKALKQESCTCQSGHKHDSRLEKRYCDVLLLLKKGKGIKDYVVQKTYSLDVNGAHICNHRVDFVVTTNSGALEVHETKGFETEVWALKKKIFEACYPDIKYNVIRKCK